MAKSFRGSVRASVRITSSGKAHIQTTISKGNTSKTTTKTVNLKKP